MFPVIFEISSFKVYTYPLFMGLAWGLAIQYALAQVDFKRNFLIYLMCTFVLAWLGAKFFFLISIPDTMQFVVAQFNFWTGGGFVFYGGLIFAGIFSIWWRYFSPFQFEMKGLVPALCLGHAIGRIGCFLTGCCFGRDLGFGEIPVQLIEAIYLGLLFKYFHGKDYSFMEQCGRYFIAYSFFRYFIEFFRADEIRGFVGHLSTSQFISIFILIIGFVIYSRRRSFN